MLYPAFLATKITLIFYVANLAITPSSKCIKKTLIIGVRSLFCYAVLSAFSSFAIIFNCFSGALWLLVFCGLRNVGWSAVCDCGTSGHTHFLSVPYLFARIKSGVQYLIVYRTRKGAKRNVHV